MTVKQSLTYSAYCDKCEDPLQCDDVTLVFDSIEDMKDSLEEDLWFFGAATSQVLCPDCH